MIKRLVSEKKRINIKQVDILKKSIAKKLRLFLFSKEEIDFILNRK